MVPIVNYRDMQGCNNLSLQRCHMSVMVFPITGKSTICLMNYLGLQQKKHQITESDITSFGVLHQLRWLDLTTAVRRGKSPSLCMFLLIPISHPLKLLLHARIHYLESLIARKSRGLLPMFYWFKIGRAGFQVTDVFIVLSLSGISDQIYMSFI